jgi:hypothetical protein
MGYYPEVRRVDSPTKILDAAGLDWAWYRVGLRVKRFLPLPAYVRIKAESWGPSLDRPAFRMTIANSNGGHPWRLSFNCFRFPPQFKDPSGRSSKTTIPQTNEFA